MSQLSGGVTVDEGHRVRTPGRSSTARSVVESRADRSSPGAWDEDLGKLGVDDWRLPGMGESGPGCGEWYPEAVCETCGHVDMGTRSCGRRSCPECWGMWAKKAGIRATVRVQAFRYTQPADYRRQAAHAVVSPPEGAVRDEREFYDGKGDAAEIAKEKGFRGFAVIPHPWRATEEAKSRYRAEVEGAEDPGREAEMGLWTWVRNETDNWREWTYWSPHYHILGMTTEDMDGAEESDRWAYTFIRSFRSFEGVRDSGSHEDVYGAFRYLLSHTGYPADSTKQATTWHGELANSKFVESAGAEWQIEKPSGGVMSALQREIEKVAGGSLDEDDEGESGVPTDDKGECPEDGCEGVLIGVFDLDRYIRQAQPPEEIVAVMRTARDWRFGRVLPPPGLRRPQSEGDAREAFAVLMGES